MVDSGVDGVVLNSSLQQGTFPPTLRLENWIV